MAGLPLQLDLRERRAGGVSPQRELRRLNRGCWRGQATRRARILVAGVGPPMLNFRQPANRRQVLRSELEHVLELLLRLIEPADFEQRPAEGDAGRQVGGMPMEAGLAGSDRLFETSGAPVLFGERRKRDGRRVQLDPASELLNARTVRHWVILLRRDRVADG